MRIQMPWKPSVFPGFAVRKVKILYLTGDPEDSYYAFADHDYRWVGLRYWRMYRRLRFGL